jgi:antitoxin component of MazEF toxin-antitoxin module
MINMSDKLDLVLKEIQEIKKEIQGVKTEQKQQNDLTTQLIHIVSATNIIHPRRDHLKNLLSQVTPNNVHGEVNTGNPVGKEIW